MGMLLRRHYMANVEEKGVSLDSGTSSKKDIKSDNAKTSRRSNRAKSVEKKEG